MSYEAYPKAKAPVRSKLRFPLLLLTILITGTVLGGAAEIPQSQEYIVIGWNDLGMHCMGSDFSSMTILPPANNLWAQVVRRGNLPQLVQEGVTLDYGFLDNSTSSDKVNFWQYAQQMFGSPLANDVGLTGNAMTGQLTWNGEAFEASAVPLTPYTDSAPTVEQPYQMASVTLRRTSDQAMLDHTMFVAPVSVEMHCDKCHPGDEDDFAGLPVWDAILKLHDEENGTQLYANRPVLCASCHSSNAWGMPGQPGKPSLSLAMHDKHKEKSSSCYDCHPGQQTQCLRDAMYIAGHTCTDCHGSMAQVASSIEQGRRPWLDEPRCASCHPAYPENEGKLYRNSTGHGGLYCAACHNSPHAVLPTVQWRDGVQAQRLQGQAKSLGDCMVCHTAPPPGPGPHGLTWSNAAQPGTWSTFQ